MQFADRLICTESHYLRPWHHTLTHFYICEIKRILKNLDVRSEFFFLVILGGDFPDIMIKINPPEGRSFIGNLNFENVAKNEPCQPDDKIHDGIKQVIHDHDRQQEKVENAVGINA